MTTQAAALRALIEKVEAGNATFQDFDACKIFGDVAILAPEEAYNGSLDAAKALHEALLPGWTVRLTAFSPNDRSIPYVHLFKMRMTEDDPVMSGNSSGYDGRIPARAWLIAILKAKLSEVTE